MPLVALAALTACASSGEAVDIGASGGTGGGGGSDAGTSTATSLAFDPADTVTLGPGETREITVRAEPPGDYRVRFALLGEPQAPTGASLDRSEARTDANGVARVQLTAPNTPALFTLRASIGTGVTAQVPVSVSDTGFASLEVVPIYSGTREAPYWVASVRTGTTCSAIAGNPPPDGDLTSTALIDQIPRIDDVPVGPVLAVTLRAAYFAGGCAEVRAVQPGALNVVEVPVTDRPIRLDETNLRVDLGLSPASSTDFEAAIQAAVAAASKAILDGAASDGQALLDAMAQETSPEFSQVRVAKSWDLALASSLPSGALREHVAAWMTAGAADLVGPSAFVGHLTSAGSVPGYAVLELESVAGYDASTAGFAVYNQLSWSAEPDDTLLLGTPTPLKAWPSRLLGTLARGAAAAEYPGSSGVPDALGQALSCVNLASTLLDATGNPVEAFPGCDAACLETLCQNGLEVIWKRVLDASAQIGSFASLYVSASGAGRVDAHARPIGFEGSWIGTLELAGYELSVGGGAQAEPSDVPPN